LTIPKETLADRFEAGPAFLVLIFNLNRHNFDLIYVYTLKD